MSGKFRKEDGDDEGSLGKPGGEKNGAAMQNAPYDRAFRTMREEDGRLQERPAAFVCRRRRCGNDEPGRGAVYSKDGRRLLDLLNKAAVGELSAVEPVFELFGRVAKRNF